MVISMPGNREVEVVSSTERFSKAERMGKELQCSHLGIVVKADREGEGIAILGMQVGSCVSWLLCHPGGLHLWTQHGEGSPAEGLDARAVAQCVTT